MSDLTERDLLLEFIQWCVDHMAEASEIMDDSDVAMGAVDKFLDQLNGEALG